MQADLGIGDLQLHLGTVVRRSTREASCEEDYSVECQRRNARNERCRDVFDVVIGNKWRLSRRSPTCSPASESVPLPVSPPRRWVLRGGDTVGIIISLGLSGHRLGAKIARSGHAILRSVDGYSISLRVKVRHSLCMVQLIASNQGQDHATTTFLHAVEDGDHRTETEVHRKADREFSLILISSYQARRGEVTDPRITLFASDTAV
jgi:hypothetical protein